MGLETIETSGTGRRRSLSRPQLPRFRGIFGAALSAMSIAGCTVDFVPSGRYLTTPDGGRRNGGVAGGEDAGGDAGGNGNGSRDAQYVNGADAHGVDAHPEDRDGSTRTADAGGAFDAGDKDAGGNIGGLDAGGRSDAGGVADAGGVRDAGGPSDAGEMPDAGDLRAPCERGVVSCSDQNACTVGEGCAPRVEGSDENGCVPGIPREISDGINCTRDGCNPETGAISHTPVDADCGDFPCKTASCEPETGCVQTNLPDGTPCDLVLEMDETCFNGSCAPVCDGNEDCNDDKTCTTDTCNIAAGRCEFTADDTACDDLLFCNGEEECNPADEEADPLTGCAPADRVPVCPDDEKTCTQELCDVEQDRCVTTPLNERCDDRDPCTGVEVCDPETGAADSGCTNPPNVDCSDLNTQCRVGICNSESGLCEQVGRPNGTPCNDDLSCNVGEVCQDGDCRVGEARNCSDGNLCTVDSCDEGTDLCVNTPVDCSELNTQCIDGVCSPETGNCEEQNKINGEDCSDDRHCTTPDTCQNGICQSGPDRDCADEIACTIDTCSNELSRCIHTADDSRCADEDLCSTDVCDIEAGDCTHPPVECVTDETCKVGICLPESGECGVANAVDDTLCDDGIACTINDRCMVGECRGDSPPEIRGNGIDDDCDGWADESPGFDVQCDGPNMRITPPGGPIYNCVGAELIEIPSLPRGSQSTQISLPPDGGGHAQLVGLMPLGTNYTEIQAFVNGGGASFAPFACPRPSPPDKSIVCIEAPRPGSAGLTDTIHFIVTP